MIGIRTTADGSTGVPLGLLAYALLVAILAALGLYAVFVIGPASRAAADESVARAVAEEDRKFCGMFGMGPDTDTFAACSRELSMIRQSQVDRDSAAQGIL